MKPPRLIRFLYRLFAILYNFQTAVLILALVLVLAGLSQLPKHADRWLHQLEGNNPRIRYDTLNPQIDQPLFSYDMKSGNAQLGYTNIEYIQLPPDFQKRSMASHTVVFWGAILGNASVYDYHEPVSAVVQSINGFGLF